MNINRDDDNDETSISNTSTMFGKLLSSILCYFNTIKSAVGLGSSFSDFRLSFLIPAPLWSNKATSVPIFVGFLNECRDNQSILPANLSIWLQQFHDYFRLHFEKGGCLRLWGLQQKYHESVQVRPFLSRNNDKISKKKIFKNYFTDVNKNERANNWQI